MRTGKSIIAICLTAALAFQMLAPSSEVFAAEAGAVSSFAAKAIETAAGPTSSASDAADEGVASDASAMVSGAETADNAGEEADENATDDASNNEIVAAEDVPEEPSEAEAASEGDATVQAGWAYSTIEQLNAALQANDGGGSASGSGDTVVIEFGVNKDLIAISNADPSLYQSATIQKSGSTGQDFDVSQTIDHMEFKGFGSDAYPFEGTFNSSGYSIGVARSFYNNVELSNGNKDVKLTWKGTSSEPIVASKLVGNGKVLAATIKVADTGATGPSESDAAITSALVGEARGALTIDASYSFTGTRKGIGIAAASGNAGLLVNTLADGTSLTIAGVSWLGDANPAQVVTASNGNAGGLIGSAGNGSTVTVNCSVDVSGLTVTAASPNAKDKNLGSAGGFIGYAANLTLDFGSDGAIKPALKVGDNSTNYAGGAIGSVSFASGLTVTPSMFSFGASGDSVVELGTRKRAGGLFGSLDVTSGDVTIQGGTYNSKLVAAGDDKDNRGSYGGIVGNVCSSNDGSGIHALNVGKSDDQNTQIEIEKAANVLYTGGVAGYVGDNRDAKRAKVALVLDGAQVTCKGSAAGHISYAKFGGAVGVLDTNEVLDARDFKVATSDGTIIGKDTSSKDQSTYKDSAGGTAGIAGSVWRGVIKFSGTTDLSDAKFADNDYTAQLVYQNYNALIFATGSGSNEGWTYQRPNEAAPIDDIHDYGQVVRLGSGLNSSLISLDETTHVLTFASALTKTGDAYVLNSADDFAKLAITWQTFGYFSMVSEVQATGKGYKSLLGSKIQIAGTIDLSGTGLTGLAKDRLAALYGDEYQQESGGDGVKESDSVFSGTLTGAGIVKLAVGEPYGKRNNEALDASNTSDGNGKIYRHARLGLFNEFGGATVSGSVTIGGTMKFDGKNDVDAGALAAVRKEGSTSISGLTVSAGITYDNTNENKTENIGGIFGQVTGGDSISFSSNAQAKPTITSRVQDQGYVRVASAIAYIAKESSVVVNASGIVIGGSISVPYYKKDTLVGGFIAYIRQDETTVTAAEKKTINITDLSFDGFSMAVNAVNSSNKTSGGLLGYSWGNAVVDVTGTSAKYALRTSSASASSVTASKVDGFGGLVYAASGCWKINDYAIDLGGAKLSAADAKQFGVLVCRAGSSAQYNSKIGVDALTGLYLKNTAPWATAYVLSDSRDAIDTSAVTFDEWIADTTRPDSKIADTTRPDSKIDDIDANGVISLHTQDETLYMGSETSKRNSYKNRTDYGKQHQANSSARYYYNLDRAVNEATANNGWIANAAGLLLWSAWRYAPSGVQDYVKEGLAPTNTSIQENLHVDGDIDLTGYSYYPVGNHGADVYVRGSLTFCYREIAQTEQGNKKNSELSQHSNMHLSLIGGFTSSTESNKTLRVGSPDKPLTLKGTIGKDVISGGFGSGALISGSLQGDSKNSRIATVSIEGQGLILDGLAVWTDDEKGIEKGGLSPLLINAMPAYASLAVNKLGVKSGSYSDNTKAATSLFGPLGGENADMVSASFANISVPSREDSGIFTHASFLESFAYKQGGTGSANYIFYKNDADSNNVTYGNEIDANGSGNEYVGKQLWYYDETLNGQPAYGHELGLVKLGSDAASVKNPIFGDYLPYVKKGKEDPAFHEIKVNQRVASIVTGCGTYGDPYVITSAAQINTVSSYINLNTAVDDWEVTIVKNQEVLCTRRSGDSHDNEITYVYRAGKWTQKNGTETIDNDTMHRYLQSAYYSIEPEDSGDTPVDTIELNTTEFTGFGNKANPFRGVIVGGLKKRNGESVSTGIVIQNDAGKTIQGLIPYSYGSVIKSLDVTYKGWPDEIAYTQKSSEDGVPTSFFGGVIGCILGGDNIIDGVTVSTPADEAFSVSASGLQPYLVPIGGYVGAIAGGGVIFRNMTGDSWLKTDKDVTDPDRLYANPYVGRVIDGYAFSEGASCSVDNDDKNYKINNLTNKGIACVETGNAKDKYKDKTNSAITTTVKNAQGLLVLSAIISSGAGGGSAHSDWSSAKDGNVYGRDGYKAETDYGSFNGSRAYAGRTTEATGSYLFGNDSLGKVRNAAYDHVGDPSGETNDFDTSKQDDRLAPGNQEENEAALDQADGSKVNSPYLVKNYATWQTGNVCAPKASGMYLQFANTTYDMTVYGTGFTGLSGRYYSNACASSYGSDRDRIVPQVACVNGNGAKIILKSDVTQYLDDDFFLQSWGGLFSAVEFTNTSVSDSLTANGGYLVKDLQLGDNSESAVRSSVSLTCKKSDGTSASYDDLTKADAVDRDANSNMPNMGVGAFAGSIANRDAFDGESEGKYSNVSLVNCDVNSASMSGGLLGNAGWAKRRVDLDRNKMVSFETFSSPVRLFDCSYSNVTVTGATRVGGFVGASGGSTIVGAWATMSDKILGENSTIASTQRGAIIGGAFGLCWNTVKVNVTEAGTMDSQYHTLTLNNVTVDNQGGFANADLDGTGGLIGNPKGGCMVAKVTVKSDNAATGDSPTYIGRKTGSKELKRVGGLVGQVDQANKTYSFTTVTVSKIKFVANDSCGGVVGYIRKGNIQLTCDDVLIDQVKVDGTWSGGILGAVDANNASGDVVSVSNSNVRQCVFSKNNIGGISGDGRGKFLLTNILFDKNEFSQPTKQGIMLGDMVSTGNMNQFVGIYASGIDVIPAQKDGKNAVLPGMIYADNEGSIKAANQKSYIAFSDYNDVLTEVTGSNLYNDERAADGSEVAVESASPYVATNPVNSKVKVKASNDESSSQKSIFGDGAAIDTATIINNEAGKTVVGRYTYTNIGGRDDGGSYQNTNKYSAQTSRSMFNENNTDSNSKRAITDFPVLLIPGNDSTTVTNYLNLVTNGGFSDAVRLNNGNTKFVTAKAERFELSDDGTYFVKSDDAPSLSVVGDGTSGMAFRASTSWDNEQSRFTLLTVSFNNGSGHTYKVQVPIIVKRMLEIDFTATYAYGTKFDSSGYEKLNNHVLTSVGDAMTGYLTWTYNQAKGQPTEYGWNSYLESGGSMGPLNKTIEFLGSEGRGTLPSGTQLTLVDPANNSREYHLTVGEGGSASVRLTDFEDASGAKYEEKWLSESMGVAAVKQDGAAWVQLPESATDEDKAKAVAKINGKYYKRAEVGDAGDRYKLSINGSEPSTSENFYLIVRVPSDSKTTVNGYTATAVSSGVNTHINYMLRDGKTEDGHQNTASTYSVALSYIQSLVDNKKTGEQEGVYAMTPDENLQYTQMKMSVTDTISTGVNEYTSNDSLFYQLNSSLVSHGSDSVTAGGYPVGTSGDAYFYVKVGDDYYTWSGSGWNETTGKWDSKDNESWTNVGPTKTPVLGTDVSTRWNANGNDMSLVLSSSDGHPIDLKGIRAIAGTGSFSITMEMDVVMTEPAAVAAIVASQDKAAETYTKPTYRSFLSTYANSLSTSNMTADNDGGVRYYRESDNAASKISLTASLLSQLGINIDDLQSADGTIALTGRYDFTDAKEGAAKLGSGTKVVYTLTLQRRQDDGSYKDMEFENGDKISNYLTSVVNDQGLLISEKTDSYVFTDSTGTPGKFATRDGDSLALVLGFRVKVNTDVEIAKQFYSNYRLVLTANMTGEGVDDTPVNAQGLTGYVNSDYITYTLTRVNTGGRSH